MRLPLFQLLAFLFFIKCHIFLPFYGRINVIYVRKQEKITKKKQNEKIKKHKLSILFSHSVYIIDKISRWKNAISQCRCFSKESTEFHVQSVALQLPCQREIHFCRHVCSHVKLNIFVPLDISVTRPCFVLQSSHFLNSFSFIIVIILFSTLICVENNSTKQ